MKGSARPAWILIVLLVLLGSFAAARAEPQPVPALRTRITDTAGALQVERAVTIEARLAAFEMTKGSQIAVLIVQTTEPETIEQYALRAAEKWKIGRSRVNDGALFVIAIKDRRMRIEVGYGLEGALNDATCKRIIDEIVKPYFQKGDITGGVEAGVEQMIKVISGEPLPPPGNNTSLDLGPNGNLLIFAFFAAIFLGVSLHSVLGRPLAAALSGGLVFIAAAVMLTFIVGLVLAAVVFMIVMFGQSSTNGRSIGRSSSGWGGSSSRSSGGGGFSGGGGSFGGGGASGGW